MRVYEKVNTSNTTGIFIRSIKDGGKYYPWSTGDQEVDESGQKSPVAWKVEGVGGDKMIGIRYAPKEYKGKPTPKLRFYFESEGETVFVNSGLETVYTVDFVYALKELLDNNPNAINEPFCIVPRVGGIPDDNSAPSVFCNLYAGVGSEEHKWDAIAPTPWAKAKLKGDERKRATAQAKADVYAVAEYLAKTYFPDFPFIREEQEDGFDSTPVTQVTPPAVQPVSGVTFRPPVAQTSAPVQGDEYNQAIAAIKVVAKKHSLQKDELKLLSETLFGAFVPSLNMTAEQASTYAGALGLVDQILVMGEKTSLNVHIAAEQLFKKPVFQLDFEQLAALHQNLVDTSHASLEDVPF